MRIIGGRDYYDGAGYGVDTKIIFNRAHGSDPFKTTDYDMQLENDYEDFPARPVNVDKTYHYEDERKIEFFNIIVGGKLYPGVKITKKIRNGIPGVYTWYDWDKGEFYYDYDKAWTMAETLGFKDKGTWNNTKADMHDHFRRELTKEEIEWFLKRRIVIAGIMKIDCRTYKICIDTDFLKYFKFYRVLDSWTAHMEIANYVGGVLPGAVNPMVEISDKSKIVKHGHDPIRSFRNMPR